MKKSRKFGVIGMGVGFSLALLFVVCAYCFPRFFNEVPISLCLCLAPASIIYMLPAGGATLGAQVVIFLTVTISNSLIYGLACWLIGTIVT